MKTINVKRIVTILAMAGVFTSVHAQSLAEKKMAVNESLAKVNQQQLIATDIKTELIKAAIIEKQTRVYQDWVTAKDNLKVDRAELRLTAKSLMKAHHANIREHQKTVLLLESILAKTQRTVDQLAIKRDARILMAADNLIMARSEFRNSLNALERARLDRDKDRFIINKELTDLNGESELGLTVDNGDDTSQTVAVK